MASPDTRN